MMKPSSHATLFASTIVAIAMLSAAPRIAAAPISPHDVLAYSPAPEDDRAAIVANSETAGMHAALRAEEQRRQARTGTEPGAGQAPARAQAEGAPGAICRVPSSNAGDDVCRVPSDAAAGAPYLHPGYGTKSGPRTYMLPLDEAQHAGY